MYRIYVDDLRPTPDDSYDKHCYTTNETLNCIRKQYKAGVRQFFLDLDNDTTLDTDGRKGGDFINILNTIDNLTYTGKFTNTQFYIRIHTGNCVARDKMRLIIKYNPSMSEIY